MSQLHLKELPTPMEISKPPYFRHHLTGSQWMQLLFSTFLLVLLAPSLIAESSICKAITHEQWLGPHTPFIRIPYGSTDQSLPTSADWTQPSPAEVPNFGFSQDTFWFKLQFSCPDLVGKELYLVIDYPNIDQLNVWTDTFEKPADWSLGDIYPFAQRPLAFADFVVPIQVRPTTTIYLQIQTQGSMSFPAKLWRPERFATHNTNRILLLGLSFGIVLIMSIYNLSIFFSVRDQSYLYLTFWIFLFGLYQSTQFGLAFQYLWPSLPSLSNHSVPLLICFSTCSACLFGVSFLNTKRNNPLAHRTLLLLAALLVALGIASFFMAYSQAIRIASFLAFTTIISLVGTGLYGILQKSRSAYYFTFAWTFLLIGIMTFIAKSAGLVPSNNFTIYSMNFGSALEIILLSFALGDKINTMQSRERKATESLLNTSLANEQLILEKNEALAKLNQTLQAQIIEIEENRKVIGEKAEQIEIETLARFMLVSDLAHKMNNSLNYLQTAQISMQSTLDQHHDDLLRIFADQDSADEEVQRLSHHLEDQLLGLQSNLTMMRAGLDRSTQTMREIRVLSGVDGYHVEAVNFFSILDKRLQMINSKLGYSGANRISCEYEEIKSVKVLSNEIVLGLAFDLILHLWRIDMQTDFRISVDPYLMARENEVAIVIKFLGDYPKVSEEDKSLFNQLRHLVRPYSLTLEWKDQYRMIIFLFLKESAVIDFVA